jgi:hypothetical protein
MEACARQAGMFPVAESPLNDHRIVTIYIVLFHFSGTRKQIFFDNINLGAPKTDGEGFRQGPREPVGGGVRRTFPS